MNLISTSWSCARCGAAFICTPPEHGLCDECLADLDALARLAPIAEPALPTVRWPGLRRLRQALIALTPCPARTPCKPAEEVTGDDG